VLLENFRLALQSLWANKMRSLLTTLGIVIGVAAVIAVVSLVQGLSQVFTTEINQLGATSIIVQPYRPPGREGKKLGRVELTWEDGQALVAHCPAVEAVAPFLERYEQEVQYGEESASYPVIGTTPIFQDLRNYYVGFGRFFSDVDERERQKVAVIGHAVIRDLKLPRNPVGQSVRIGRHSFQVIGVMEPKGDFFGQNFDKFVLVPFSTAAAVYGEEAARRVGLLARAVSAEAVDRAERQIEDLLRIRHGLRSDQPNDFQIVTQKEILKTFTKVSNGVSYVVAGVVSIALFVGGIGIMNIMLVSVTERTREIGVRKAVGARRVHILAQFIIEAVTLALAGGLVGVFVGIAVGIFVARLIPHWPGWYVPPWAVMLSVSFSSAVGLFFGIYPAAKAARLDPIESLRYE
jgi:putative ABC transport system permease protein